MDLRVITLLKLEIPFLTYHEKGNFFMVALLYFIFFR